MAYIDYIETDFHDYALKWSDDYKIWRNARVMDTYVSGGSVFADGSYCKGSHLGVNVLLNRGAFVLKSTVGDKSQIGFNTKVLYPRLASIAVFLGIVVLVDQTIISIRFQHTT